MHNIFVRKHLPDTLNQKQTNVRPQQQFQDEKCNSNCSSELSSHHTLETLDVTSENQIEEKPSFCWETEEKLRWFNIFSQNWNLELKIWHLARSKPI